MLLRLLSAAGTAATLSLLRCAISGAILWTMESPDAFLLPAAALLAIVVAGRKGRGAQQ